MRRIYSILSLVFLSVLFFQCQKELSYFGGPDNVSELPTPDPITSVVQGNVLDEAGLPASGVMIQVGSKTATTDAKGYFRIYDASLDKKASLVTATKSGYFKAYRTFSATSGVNQVVIKLIKRDLAGNVSASSGGEVSLSNGSKIALPANGIVIASNNNPYSGTVNVYASYIDPTSSDINQTIPGSFIANDKDGKRVTLASYGMIAVELESTSGERLQIKSGASATLTTAIPSASQSSAPTTIALWSVDETTGIWKEEGAATKNGNVYVGDVKHFSFWNCDVSQSAIMLSMTIKNAESIPVVHAAVRLTRTTANGTSYSYGYTDSLGQVKGYVPSNQALVLEVMDECGQPFYSQNIGPFTQATDLGVITINNTGTALVTIKGKLLNCGGTSVSNGYVIISYGNTVRYAAANATGDFQTTFTRCSNSSATVDIIGVDNGAQQQGSSSTINVAVPLTAAGNVTACGTSSSQFINYTLDGTNYSISSTNANDSLMAYTKDSLQGSTLKSTIFTGSQIGGSNRISLYFQHASSTAGTYAATTVAVQNYQSSTNAGTSVNVTINNFPQSVGLFYDGSFSGTFKDASNATHTLNGTFKLRRSF